GQGRRGERLGRGRRADAQYRPVLRAGPREQRQGQRARALITVTRRPDFTAGSAHAPAVSFAPAPGRQASSVTVLRKTPICGDSTSTTSPGLSHTGGLRCTPAPVGVPVQIRSPGLSVANVLM